MNPFSLERSLHILGPVLGKKRGVVVRVGGAQACTDGKTIWLPALPIDDVEAAALGFGLLFHETNHVRYTDFAVSLGDGLVGALTNVLEDIRIDGLGHHEYPGGKREEEQLVAALIRRGEAKSCAKDDHPARILESYVMWRLECDLLGIGAARPMADEAGRIFRKTFTPSLKTKLDVLMFGVRDCHSTSEAQTLARAIVQMLDDEARVEEAQLPQSQAAQEVHGAQGAQARSGTTSTTVLRRVLEAAADDHASGIGELAQAAINAKGREAPSLNLPMPCAATRRARLAVAAAGSFSAEIKTATNRLRQRLAGLLQAQTLCRRYPAVTGKRIDTRRLCRIEAGDARIYLRHAAGFKTDTAVQILIDRSGSMGSSRARRQAATPRPIEVARASCYAAALALGRLPGVAAAVAAFPGDAEHDVVVLARFDERIDHQAERFASLEARGGTPMAEAMLWAASELLARNNSRRIVLMATDGAYDEALGKAMTERLNVAGIETLGIGIQCDVSRVFPRSRQIATVDELPQAMFDLLLEALQHQVMH